MFIHTRADKRADRTRNRARGTHAAGCILVSGPRLVEGANGTCRTQAGGIVSQISCTQCIQDKI